MRDCATVNVMLRDDGTPMIQFAGNDLFASLSPVDKAVVAMAARKICDVLISDLINLHPEHAAEIRDKCENVGLVRNPGNGGSLN